MSSSFLLRLAGHVWLCFPCRSIRTMPMVMTNSLGQVTLNSSPIFTTTSTAGGPLTMGGSSGGPPPKLVIQAMPSVLPAAGAKAGEKITIITIPANQLASLMQANSAGQLTQFLQARTLAGTHLTQVGPKAPPPTATLQLAPGRPVPQLILAKPAALAQALPQLSVQRVAPPLSVVTATVHTSPAPTAVSVRVGPVPTPQTDPATARGLQESPTTEDSKDS